MAKITPRTLSGFMELLPAPQQQLERMMDILRKTYALYGFTPLDTPVIEASEVLLAKGGGETEKQIYRFQKGDADLALRFDLTVPLAKYVALHGGDLSFPFRRYQIGKVYRGERAQRGRFREFYQADIDIIGDGDIATYSMNTISEPRVEALPLFNLLSVIEGRVLNDAGDLVDSVTGDVVIALPQSCENLLWNGKDHIVLCGDQPDMIRRALETNVCCLILCQTEVDQELLANARNTCIISSPQKPFREFSK